MIISYPTHSQFLLACETAIANNLIHLDQGSPIEVQFPSEFSDKGYSGSVQIHIYENQYEFDSDWKGADKTRFPARIKAAALALFNQKCFGSYKVVHQDGRIEITNLSSLSQKSLRKEIKKSQHTDGVRINNSHQEIFNPPGTKFYVEKGTSREITVHFNGKTFDARYLRENPQGTNREMQSIRFSQELKEEFQKVSPNLEGSFSISLGADPREFIFRIIGARHQPDILEDIEAHKIEYKTLDKTEQDSVVKSRIGQGAFRDNLIKLWGSCAVTGVKTLSLLKASHIKPWRDSTNKERLDPHNGLLLTPNLDELFDCGFITFDSNGYIQISDKLSQKDRNLLGVASDMKLRKQLAETEEYLNYHRDNVFMW